MVDIQRHNRDIISNWNSIVGKNDEVWILGDLAWKNHSRYILALNGKKYLIRGNHDKMDLNSFNMFAPVGGSHYQYSYFTTIRKQNVMVSHCPYETWFSSCYNSWHLHGHCHGRLPERKDLLRFDVGVDVWGFYPVPWDIICDKMIEKEKEKKEFFDSKKISCSEEDGIEANESSIHFEQNKTKNLELMRKAGILK